MSACSNTRTWHGVLYWLSPFTKGNDPLRQSHVRVTTLLFCLYFQKSFHSSNNAPIYAMYTYINHCKESGMTIFLIIGLQYPWRRNWDSDPGTTLRCLRFSRPLHSTTLPLRHNNEFPVPQKSFARFVSYAIKAAFGKECLLRRYAVSETRMGLEEFESPTTLL